MGGLEQLLVHSNFEVPTYLDHLPERQGNSLVRTLFGENLLAHCFLRQVAPPSEKFFPTYYYPLKLYLKWVGEAALLGHVQLSCSASCWHTIKDLNQLSSFSHNTQ